MEAIIHPPPGVNVFTNHPAMLAKTVDHEIQSIGHKYSTHANTLAQMSEQALLRQRATAVLSSFFAAVAPLLAGIGLFGLMSYTVSRRTREVGIPMALGSPRRDILRMILRETLILTLAGIAIGLPSALAATRLATHMLFGCRRVIQLRWQRFQPRCLGLERLPVACLLGGR